MRVDHDAIARMRMSETAVEKTWVVPAYEGKGPVTMTLRIPEITITDSEGRQIVISPRQSAIVGARMTGISDWLNDGDGDWDVTADVTR